MITLDRSVKLTTSLPEGDANGLADPDVIRQLLEDPTKLHVGIIIFSVPKSATDHDKGTTVGGAVIRRIEAIMDDRMGDASALERLLMRAYERRTGATTLDAELEDDVRAAFDDLHLDDEPNAVELDPRPDDDSQ